MSSFLTVRRPERCIACYCCMQACARVVNRSAHPGHSALRVLPPVSEFSNPVIRVCQGCIEPGCAQECPRSALVAQPGGGVKFSPESCTGCGLCAQACPVGVITMVQVGNTGEDIRENIRKDTWEDSREDSRETPRSRPIICCHCGSCARFCPQGILAVEVRREA